jgi:hypothetical protein
LWRQARAVRTRTGAGRAKVLNDARKARDEAATPYAVCQRDEVSRWRWAEG